MARLPGMPTHKTLRPTWLLKAGLTMIEKTSKNAILLVAVLAFASTGCATVSVDTLATPAADIADSTYEVEQDDRLSEIALRLTGESSNWNIIAARNNITDPRALAVGTVLIIPGELFENKATVAARDTENTAQVVDITDLSALAPRVTTGAGVSVLQGHSAPDLSTVKDSADITVSAVTINRTFDLQPIEQALETDHTSQRYDSAAPQIRVTGTYYPKGVYEQPANYARLIGRAAPGTLFELDNEINDWYKIITDQGIGYIRSSDSAIVK